MGAAQLTGTLLPEVAGALMAVAGAKVPVLAAALPVPVVDQYANAAPTLKEAAMKVLMATTDVRATVVIVSSPGRSRRR